MAERVYEGERLGLNEETFQTCTRKCYSTGFADQTPIAMQRDHLLKIKIAAGPSHRYQ